MLKKKKMNTKITFLIVIGGLLLSCENLAKETTKQNTPQNQQLEQHKHSTEIELDNGKKWKVDDEMMIHLRNMEKDLKEFNPLPEKNYTKLSIKLSNNLELLTSNCTMTGKAHDELHKWLVPFIDLVNELDELKSIDESNKVITQLQQSFTVFNRYFN